MGIAFGRINNPILANFINLNGHSSFDDAVLNVPSAKDKLIASNIINELIATIIEYDEFDNIKNPHPYNWLWESKYPFTNQWIEAQAKKLAVEEWQGKLLIRRADADDEDYEMNSFNPNLLHGSLPYLDIMYISLVNIWDDKDDEMLVYNLRVFEYNKSIEYSENAFRDDRGAEWIALYDGHSFGGDISHIRDIDYFKGWYDATPLITNIIGFRTWPFINWATTPLGDS